MEYDAIVVGGSFAGLAAATYLARARRTVCIVDSRRPRNRFAEAAHGFLTQDGADPTAILAIARAQVAAYATVRMIEGEVRAAARAMRSFTVTLENGETLSGRKLVLAFGLRDVLPAILGLEGRWGKTVLHCPYCHGLEFGDRRLGVLYRVPMSLHQASLIADWGPTTLFSNGADLDAGSARMLADRGVAIEPGLVKGLEGEGVALSHVVLDEGRRVAVDALFIAPDSRLASPVAAELGLAIDDAPLGPMIRTDPDKMTTVPGVYAAGDIARAPHSITWAAADGVTAGTAAHRALVFG